MVRSQIQVIENGYIVIITTLSALDGNRQPQDKVYIAATFDEALQIIKDNK